jgi:DNA-directed RNA polymerase beta' subunit
MREIYLEEVVQPILCDMQVCGISGIKKIYFNDSINNFQVQGDNFLELLNLSFIDYKKTLSNNMWDIYNILGIEATRSFLINEFLKTMSGINSCHVELLIDKMTYNGGISSISRYTMRNEDHSPLGKASFEETMDNLIKSSFYSEKEHINNISASIICGQRGKFGTGSCDLIMDLEQLNIK